MSASLPPSLRRRVTLTGIAIVLALVPTFGQVATPRPRLLVTQMPELTYDVWPIDANNDGRTDLVAGGTLPGQAPGTQPGYLVLRIGRGDGTFAAARAISATPQRPLTTADFNRDGNRDLVVTEGTYNVSGVYVRAGNGDGTFGPAVFVDAVIPTFAVVADFDGDGHTDLAVGEEGYSLHLYAGRGDFTFTARVTLETGAFPFRAIASDLNGDNRPDIALTARYDAAINIFTNTGGLRFSVQSIRLPGALPADLEDPLGITAWDLDGDGDRELIVSSGKPDYEYEVEPRGHLLVYRNGGNGTFAAPVAYDTERAPMSVVAGDFNGDGRPDVATGNQSPMRDPACDSWLNTSDSVSVLAGRGDGTLGPRASFALDYNLDLDNLLYIRQHHSLKTSDLNGDRRTDLIASPGAILINAPPAANRPPTVNVGPDLATDEPNEVLVIDSRVGDPDSDWLTYRWTDEAGGVLGRSSRLCLRGMELGVHTITLTVDDGRGGIASDSLEVTAFIRNPAPFVFVRAPEHLERVTAGRPYTVRWTVTDDDPIVRVDVAYTLDNGQTLTPIPGCTNLPGSAQQCVWSAPGPVAPNVRVKVTATDSAGGASTSGLSEQFFVVPAGDPGGLPPACPSADIGAVGAPGRSSTSGSVYTVSGAGADIWGTADEFHFLHCRIEGGFEFTARAVSVQNVNQWTKAGLMVREGLGAGARHASLFATPTTAKGTAFQRRPVAGGLSAHTSGPAWAPPVWLKMIRSGNLISTFVRQNINDVWQPVGEWRFPELQATLEVGFAVSSHVDGRVAAATFDSVTFVPQPFRVFGDVGATGLAGDTAGDAVNIIMRGGGADIWGTADAFHFAAGPVAGDGTITTRVRSLANTNPWAKAGVMFRESFNPGARHAMLIVSPGKGVAMQYRGTTGGASANVAIRAGTAPEWLRMTRRGNTFTGYVSDDGATWTTVGAIAIPMAAQASAGLAVTSHDASRLTTAVFDNTSIMRP